MRRGEEKVRCLKMFGGSWKILKIFGRASGQYEEFGGSLRYSELVGGD